MKQYAEIKTSQRPAKIALEPTGWGKPYLELHKQTDVSGYEKFLLESTDNFNNQFQQAMEAIYRQRGWFGLILRDVIRDGGKGTDDKGRLNMSYVSHAGTEWEKSHDVWAPKNGWHVPNDDCEKINGIIIPFMPGTVIPFETVGSRNDAVKRFEKHGVNPDYVSYFYRLDKYTEDMFVGRSFGPGLDGLGRFFVIAGGPPSIQGDVGVASLPAYEEQDVVMEVDALPQAAKA